MEEHRISNPTVPCSSHGGRTRKGSAGKTYGALPFFPRNGPSASETSAKLPGGYPSPSPPRPCTIAPLGAGRTNPIPSLTGGRFPPAPVFLSSSPVPSSPSPLTQRSMILDQEGGNGASGRISIAPPSPSSVCGRCGGRRLRRHSGLGLLQGLPELEEDRQEGSDCQA